MGPMFCVTTLSYSSAGDHRKDKTLTKFGSEEELPVHKSVGGH